MQKIRPFIFWFFTVMFFVIASTVVFYAFGYRFNFERGIFIYTGSISIKSNPETVDIRVDTELIPKQNLGILNNSILISGLTPGEHFIEVSAVGYLPWSKKALVQSGLSTEFWNVLLTKEDPAPQEIPEIDSALKLFPAPDQNLFAIAKRQGETFLVDTLDISTNTRKQVFALEQVSLPSTDENIEWSPDNRKLIIPLEQDASRSYSVVNVEDDQTGILQPLTPHAESLSNPRWDSTTRNLLFYLRGTTLFRADTEVLDAPPTLIKEHIRAYDISGSNIYYLSDDNGIIYRIPASKTDAQPVQITTASIAIDPESAYSLVVYDDNRLAIREHVSGKLWMYNKLSSSEIILKPLAENNVKGVQFSNDGKKLLFFTNNEISTYFTTDWEAQPIREHNTTLQVARFSNPIRNVQWTKDYEHVLFTLQGSAKIVELDNRDRRNISQMTTFLSPITQVLSRFEDNQIYFILETGKLNVIEFPAPQNNLFGF